jgi:hypothetical protein
LSALPLTSDKLCEEKSAFSFLIGKIESESRCFTKFPEIADGSAGTQVENSDASRGRFHRALSAFYP